MSGIQQNNLAKAQSGLYLQAAQEQRQAGGQQAAAEEARNLSAIHAGIASAAAGGTAATAGSAGALMCGNLSKTILQSTFTRYGANLQAGSEIAESAVARYMGRSALLGGFVGAGTSALTQAFNAYSMNKAMPGTTLIY